MSEDQEVKQLELLCTQLYESQDPIIRGEAEKALIIFQSSPDALSKCQLLLERSESSYAQLLACNTLTKLVSRSNTLPLQQRLDIRNYVLNYLATRTKLPSFVIQALVTLFARISKLGWFDGEKDECFVFRSVVGDISKFLQGSVEHCIIGVQLLAQLTSEMNQILETDGNRSLAKHRKIASSFRDTQLFEIFRLACSILGSAIDNCKNMNLDDTQNSLMTHCLRLAHNCLTYDFIGTATDESSDDLCTVQIPTNWRPAFLDPTTLKLFFDLYHSLPSTVSPLAISCLVQMASVRRSLFSNAERAKFLNNLIIGVKQILQNPQGLRDPSNYHEFCRLLARLKMNYQLGELVTIENYTEVIRLITTFTVESMQVWQFAPNSVHYLLNLWQRMVASVPYVKASEPHLLETYTPQVTSAYISARLEAVPVIIRDGLDDPLDDLNMVMQQLEQISVIARCDYQKTCTLLVQVFDQAVAIYRSLVSTPNTLPLGVKIQEGRITWLVYIMGSAIGGRISFNTNEEHDIMDGEMAVRVLQFMNLTDSNLPQEGGSPKLELAYIFFFDQFRKIYIGEQVPKTSKVFKRLHEVLGISDEQLILSVYIRKIITNLKYLGHSELAISKTLQLFSDLSIGYTCVRKLVKLDEVNFILTSHTSEHFPFLGNNVEFSEMRLRSLFYSSLGRLLMVDLGEDDDKFDTFVIPMQNTLQTIGTLISSGDRSVCTNDEIKKQLIGLARDLRGLAFAFTTKPSFMLLFDWLYPKYISVFVQAMEVYGIDNHVSTPILKFYAEMVQNRSQRLQLDVSSPHGILLFREASKIVCAYAKATLGTECSKEHIYPMKLKGISICFSMLKAALTGNYVNFGVFKLYGDDTLDNALHTAVKLALSIPRDSLLEYPKLSQTHYVLLECLAQDHMTFLATLEPQIFLYILTTILDGLNATSDTIVCTGCCASLDYIVSYLFKQVQIKEKKTRLGLPIPNDPILQVLELHADILQQILNTVLNIIMYDDCKNQWSMSRPLLALILLNEQYYNQLRDGIISSQPPDKQASVAQWFETLMDGIERNLLSRNRDRFTQNISNFKKEITEKGTNISTVCSPSDMITT